MSSRLCRDTVGVAVVGDAIVDIAARRARAALIDHLLRQRRIRLAHVELLVDHHAELAYFLYITVLPRIKGQTLPPDGCVAFGQSYDVARHQQLTRFIPDGDVHAGGAVRHFERSNFAVLFGDGRVANLQNDKHYVDVLLARPDVLYHHVIHRASFQDSGYTHTVTARAHVHTTQSFEDPLRAVYGSSSRPPTTTPHHERHESSPTQVTSMDRGSEHRSSCLHAYCIALPTPLLFPLLFQTLPSSRVLLDSLSFSLYDETCAFYQFGDIWIGNCIKGTLDCVQKTQLLSAFLLETEYDW